MAFPLNRGNNGNSDRPLFCTKVSRCGNNTDDLCCQKLSPLTLVAQFECFRVSSHSQTTYSMASMRAEGYGAHQRAMGLWGALLLPQSPDLEAQSMVGPNFLA